MSPIALGIGGTIFVGICYGTWRNPRLWSALIWAFVATFMLSAAVLMAFPAPFAEKAFAMTIIMPLVWVGLQFWLYWNPGRWTVTLILFGIIAVSTVIVVLSPPPV
ncbi:MAG: hypothetical protein ABJ205_04480 [Erythrobacter sp.]|uniref:hypothetical protein n=1 Tax=Erythrobacter sp. TaxID=1042 RepID=UPI0032646716